MNYIILIIKYQINILNIEYVVTTNHLLVGNWIMYPNTFLDIKHLKNRYIIYFIYIYIYI